LFGSAELSLIITIFSVSFIGDQQDLSSLDESVVDSSKTESDGEDYLIGLTKSIVSNTCLNSY